MAVNLFPNLVHIAHHTMGASHARSCYLNRKRGNQLYIITKFISSVELIRAQLFKIFSHMCMYMNILLKFN